MYKNFLPICLSLLLSGAVFAGDLPADNPIENFQLVEDGLYRGASPGPEGVAYLKKMGVKTIINLEARSKVIKIEKAEAAKAGIEFHSFPITLFTLPGTKKTDLILDLMRDPARRPLFVHCRAGRDRTGLFVGLHRVETQRWQPAHAWQEMLDMGFRKIYFPLIWIFEKRTGYDI